MSPPSTPMISVKHRLVRIMLTRTIKCRTGIFQMDIFQMGISQMDMSRMGIFQTGTFQMAMSQMATFQMGMSQMDIFQTITSQKDSGLTNVLEKSMISPMTLRTVISPRVTCQMDRMAVFQMRRT